MYVYFPSLVVLHNVRSCVLYVHACLLNCSISEIFLVACSTSQVERCVFFTATTTEIYLNRDGYMKEKESGQQEQEQ